MLSEAKHPFHLPNTRFCPNPPQRTTPPTEIPRQTALFVLKYTVGWYPGSDSALPRHPSE